LALPDMGRHAAHKAIFLILVLAGTAWAWTRPSRLLAAPGGRRLPFILSMLALCGATAAGMLAVSNFSNFDWGDISFYLSSFRSSHGWLPGENAVSGRLFLAHHSEFWCIPVGWLFRLAPGPYIVQAAQAGFVLATWAIVRSWIKRTTRDEAWGEWLAFAFALSPCLIVPLLKGFHGAATALPFLALAATAYHDRRWRIFLPALLGLMLAKEVFALTAISLGCLALLQRRPWHWIVIPVSIGLAYGLFLRFWFFPHMLGDSGYFYSHLGQDWRAGMHRVLSADSAPYAIAIVVAGGGAACLRSPYVLLALPSLFLNVYLGGTFASPAFHYVIEPAFWAFFAGIASLARRPRESEPVKSGLVGAHSDLADSGTIRLIPGRAAVSSIACLLLLALVSLRGLPLYLHHPYAASYQAALARIPEGATLSSGVPLDDRLWKTGRWYWIHYGGEAWLWYSADEACLSGRYALLPLLPGPMSMFDADERSRIQACLTRLRADTAYAEIWSDGTLALLRRRAE
jgi:hypothetical protein